MTKAMIMAAGRGTRLKPLTDVVAKPALPVGNEPAMGHLLRHLTRFGIREVVINCCYLADQLQHIFGDGTSYGVEITWSVEEELLGTAGGVKNAEASLRTGEPVLVLSGDGLHNIDVGALLDRHRESQALVSLALTPVDDPSHYGVAVLDSPGDAGEGFITSFQEKPAPGTERSNLSNTGIYVLADEVFDMIPAGEEYDFGSQLFPDLVTRERALYGIATDAYWDDIGGFAAYHDANLAFVDGRYQDSLEDTQLVSPTALVDPSATLQNRVVICPGAVVEAGAFVSDSVVLPGATVTANTVLTGAVHGNLDGLSSWVEAL